MALGDYLAESVTFADGKVNLILRRVPAMEPSIDEARQIFREDLEGGPFTVPGSRSRKLWPHGVRIIKNDGSDEEIVRYTFEDHVREGGALPY